MITTRTSRPAEDTRMITWCINGPAQTRPVWPLCHSKVDSLNARPARRPASRRSGLCENFHSRIVRYIESRARPARRCIGWPAGRSLRHARIFIAMRWYDAQNQFRTMEADFVTAYWKECKERRRSKSSCLAAQCQHVQVIVAW